MERKKIIAIKNYLEKIFNPIIEILRIKKSFVEMFSIILKRKIKAKIILKDFH